ncbi:MAG TPA: glycosyl transferase [Hungateiclostridium thermocellum]|jgi:hypothetical protein|uniref:Glycosyltransferase n=2 Tax=Acetivibrio thermocellus TaxID=1515 RepID=A3DF59_ACET2|nr:ATP-grasp fold amidoligase family protein [Acetivibrio thermocellus]CDG36031.1 glycosyltransferase [Acetivibrio thermocellus BC1]ABN52588.1 glycosyltransferase [Acetivibrio thermocellus ATCC 27405]ADU73965.1 glycosyltransferase [Acetivibrio thermocellus DSM 1313]ALX07903.1 hypothetical protein AD2_00908 [Acetivibrio thermocellus AD2]ANV75649.1 glycosyltransferase [Acetivibrio thermocellus DSM 2360]
MKKIKDILTNPLLYITLALGRILPKNIKGDELYLRILYRVRLKKKLNLQNPQRYNEKLQWLKLYDRRPEYTKMVDKYEVKKYVAEKIGEKYVIPTLGVWDRFEDINFDLLPEQFVLKCTHDSGGIVICKDKKCFDFKQAKKKIERCLKRNYYLNTREWPYKDVKPRIIAEQYMVDESGYELKDYKFFAFDGKVKALFIATDRGIDTRFDFYDTDFNHLPIQNGYPNATRELKKPENFELMIKLAEVLSEGIPHVRIDFYNVNGRVYFGEMTFFHWSGLKPFIPDEWDYKFGSWITLPLNKT